MSLDICSITDLHVDECDCSRHRTPAPRTPGVYRSVPDVEYHADHSSLSSSGARTIVFASPAQFRHEQLHGAQRKTEYDEGHAAHLYVLGDGAELEVFDEFKSWQSDKAKAAAAAARVAGRVPLLRKQDDTARAMAKVVRNHELASTLFSDGEAELSGWWTDPETGARLRFRLDYLRVINGRMVIVDYKTSKGAGRAAFAKAAGEYGYYLQTPFYVEGVRALELADDPAFLFVTQCKTPPYEVTVVELDAEDIERGRQLNRLAIRTWAECMATGQWPDGSDRVHTVSVPPYIRYRDLEILS